MAEVQEPSFIPGDDVSVTIGQVEHRMHLHEVRAVFRHQTNTNTDVLVLRGYPQQTDPPQRLDPQARVFYSKVRLEAIIDRHNLPGRYWCERVEAQTISGETVQFDTRLQHVWNAWVIQVLPEPTTPPTFPAH